jgi:signal peptidase II
VGDRRKDKHKDPETEPELDELPAEEGGEELPSDLEEEHRGGGAAPILSWVLFLVLPCYLLDQLVKFVIVKKVVEGFPIEVIPGFFEILHVRNRGAAFGMLQNLPEWLQPFRTYFFLGVTVVAFVAMLVIFLRSKEKHWLIKLVFGLIIAGALGNLTDRFVYGSVVDFLSVGIGSFRWPTFNLADTYISLGMMGLLLYIFTTPREEDE